MPEPGLRVSRRLHKEKPSYRFHHTAVDSLFAEQVSVRPGAGQRQNQHIILNPVGKKTVWAEATFAHSPDKS